MDALRMGVEAAIKILRRLRDGLPEKTPQDAIDLALGAMTEKEALDSRVEMLEEDLRVMERALEMAVGCGAPPSKGGCQYCIHGHLAKDGEKNCGWPRRWQCSLPKEKQNDVPMGALHCVPGSVEYFKRKAREESR